MKRPSIYSGKAHSGALQRRFREVPTVDSRSTVGALQSCMLYSECRLAFPRKALE
jgi:hypothetical protein